jgi:hypothetical protein
MRPKRLVYCILSTRAPGTAERCRGCGPGGGGETRVRARLRHARRRANLYSTTYTENTIMNIPSCQVFLGRVLPRLSALPILRRSTGKRTASRPIMASPSLHVRLRRRLLQRQMSRLSRYGKIIRNDKDEKMASLEEAGAEESLGDGDGDGERHLAFGPGRKDLSAAGTAGTFLRGWKATWH